MPDDYPPDSIRVLAGMERPARDPDDPHMRWVREFLDDPRGPLLPVMSPRVQAALESIMRDCGFSEAMIRGRFPEPRDKPQGLATFDLMEHPSYRAVARTFLDGYLQSRGIPPCEWPEDLGPTVEIVDPPGGNGPFVGGTRIPAATILAYVRAGYPDAEIHADYPTLPVGGVDAVRWGAAGLCNELPDD